MDILIHDVEIDETHPFCLIPISDVHIGHVDHDKEFARKTIEWIKNKGASTLILGDMIDGIWHKDPRFEIQAIAPEFKPYMDSLHQRQVAAFLELVEPIKENIIMVMAGNHEDSVRKHTGFDPTKIIAESLNVPELIDPSYVVLRFNYHNTKRLVNIFCTHGTRLGGRKRGVKVNTMEDWPSKWDADIYLAGHTHDIFETRRVQVRLSRTGKYEKRRIRFIQTGSFMDTYPEPKDKYSTWASRKLFDPVEPGVARIDFYAKRKGPKRRKYIDIHART